MSTDPPTPSPTPGAAPGATDPLLEHLLELNSSGLRLSLTVVAEGAILSGLLVPLEDYLAVVADLFASAAAQTAPEDREELRVTARAFFGVDAATAAMIQRRADREGENPPPPEPLRFVHLLNARALSGPTFAPAVGAGVPMRIRVSAVSAWWLGTISPVA